MTLREHMAHLEGAAEADRQIARGLRAWSVERWEGSPGYRYRELISVFGTCRSDALRRAAAPARLGEPTAVAVETALPFECGWDDEPLVHPRWAARRRG